MYFIDLFVDYCTTYIYYTSTTNTLLMNLQTSHVNAFLEN